MRPSLALAVASLIAAPLAAGVPERTVRLRMTTAGDLPPASRATLIQEATAIWQRAGVTLAWEPAGSKPTASLRVLVVHRAPPAPEGEWPVGELVMARQDSATGEAPVPIAFVSIEASRQILETAGLPSEPDRMTHRRLGIVLGRAVAHEIGHYLLATPTHAASGLMRARIAAADFADLRDGAFFLDRHASRWLRDEGGPRQVNLTGSPGFHYGTH